MPRTPVAHVLEQEHARLTKEADSTSDPVYQRRMRLAADALLAVYEYQKSWGGPRTSELDAHAFLLSVGHP